MAHYRTGAINVNNGSTTVTGIGTDWINNASAGECLLAPDGKLYEIASIQSSTSMTLAVGYQGASVGGAGQAYSIIPTQSFIRDLASQAAALVNGFGSVQSNAGAGKFGDGTVSQPGVRFAADEDTGMRRVGSNALNLVAGGADVVQVTSSGVTVPALAYTGTLTGGTGVINIGSGQIYKDAAGNVGVGTASPAAKLHIAGATLRHTDETGSYGYTISTTSNTTKLATLFGGSSFAIQTGGSGSNQLVLDSAGNLGIGTASPAAKLDVAGTQHSTLAKFGATSPERSLQINQYLTNGLGETGYEISSPGFSGLGELSFAVGGTRHVRLDGAGNLGIGTSSPVGRLTVQGAAGTSGINQGIGLLYSNGTHYGAFGLNNSTGWPQLMARAGAGITFHTNSDLVTSGNVTVLDSAGNLGLGVTPSAWRTNAKAVQLGASSGIEGLTNNGSYVAMYANAYNNGTNYIYQNTASASLYQHSSGSHIWYTAPAGTAGNPISFTQAMTLDSGGKLTVGNPSGLGGLSLNSGYSNWFTFSSSAIPSSFGAFLKGGAGTPVGYIGTDGGGIVGGGSGDNFGIRSEGALLLLAGATERARIDASGNLGVGTGSPFAKLHVNPGNGPSTVAALFTSGATDPAFRAGFANGGGTTVGSEQAKVGLFYGTDVAPVAHIGFLRGGSADSNGMTFNVNDTERVRIDPAGNLLVGRSSPLADERFAAYSASASITTTVENARNLSGDTAAYWSMGANTANTSSYFLTCVTAGVGAKFYVLGNGNVQNSNNSYGGLSDAKLKDNITDVSPKLSKLMQVRIVNYTLKSDPSKAKLLGVIAQELEQVMPGLVEETPDFEEVTRTREIDVPAIDAVLDDDGNEVTPAVAATTRTETYAERVPTGTTTKAVKYSVFVPILIKALQEGYEAVQLMQQQLDAQNTAMQLLAERVAALEARP